MHGSALRCMGPRHLIASHDRALMRADRAMPLSHESREVNELLQQAHLAAGAGLDAAKLDRLVAWTCDLEDLRTEASDMCTAPPKAQSANVLSASVRNRMVSTSPSHWHPWQCSRNQHRSASDCHVKRSSRQEVRGSRGNIWSRLDAGLVNQH